MLRSVLDRLGTNLYSGGPLRSVPELLQNAQDAHATKVVFVLDEDAVLVYNDGDPFAAYQVEDICSIAQSHKSEREIGWMGLGFKSVFTISEHPQVTSGRFNFEFESLVVPRPVDDAIESPHLPSFSTERGAWFRLPFKAKGLRDVILNGWRQLSPHLLLFLPQLERVDFIDVRKGEQWFFEKRTVDEGMVDLVSSGVEPTTWRVYHRQLAEMAEEAGHKKRVPSISLAFPHRIDESLKSEALYCYLPTQITTGLNFLVHADFGLDISRESLLDDEDNRTILQAAGKLASEAIKEMLSEPAIGASALDFIPETIDVQHHLVQILEQEIIDCLRSTRFLIAEGGIRISPKSAVIGEPRIKRLFTGQDLRRLFKRRVHFLRDDLVTSEGQRRILIRLGVEQVTVNHVISLLHTKETQQRQAEWFLDCYDYLHQAWRRAVPDPRTPHQVAWIDELRRLPCVLTTLKHPRLVPPGGFAPGEVVSYSAGQGASELERTFRGRGLFLVHRSLWLSGGRGDDEGESVDELEAQREQVKEFLCSGLGVRRTADVTTVIEGIILPRLQQTSRLRPDEVLRLTDYVRRNLDAYGGRVARERSASRTDPLRRLREELTLRCHTWKNGRRVLIWCSPGRAYLGHEYTGDRELGNLFRGVDGVAFVSPDYLKVETDSEFKGRGRSRTRIPAWREFFRAIGAHEHISVVQQRRERLDGNDSVFEWLSWPSHVPSHYRYDPSRHRLTDWVSEDLTGLLAHLDQLDIAPAIAKATLLWKHLERHWSEFASLVAGYEYRYSTWYTSKQNTCTFKEQLRRRNWMANESKNRLFKPAQLHHPRNKALLGDAVDYAAWRVRKQFADAIGLPYRVSGTDILDRLRSIRSRPITEWTVLSESIGQLYHELVDLGISEEVQAAFAHEPLILAMSSRGYAWFSSSQCLWADERERFFDLFGCLAPLYEEKFLPTFERLGVTAKPTLHMCVQALQDIKIASEAQEQRDIRDHLVHAVTGILLLMEQLVGESGESQFVSLAAELANVRLPAETGRFLRPESLFLADSPLHKDHFAGRLNFLYLTVAPAAVTRVATLLGVPSLRDRMRPRVSTAAERQFPPSLESTFLSRMRCLEHIVKYKFPVESARPEFALAFQLLHEITPRYAAKINVCYEIQRRNDVLSQEVVERVYVDRDRRIAWSARETPMALELASELARFFGSLEQQVRSIARVVLQAGQDEEALDEYLREEGIPPFEMTKEEEADAPAADTVDKGRVIRLLPHSEDEDDQSASATPPVPKKEPGRPKSLIDPEQYVPTYAVDPEKVEGKITKLPSTRSAADRKPRGTTGRPKPEGKLSWNIPDKERAAINLAMQVEESEGRLPKDVHNEEGLGYDIISFDDAGKEARFIEVKMTGAGQPFAMQLNQWSAAKIYGDKYFIYAISGLLEGEQPTIYAIRNPSKRLNPAPPEKVEIPRWDANAAIRYEFRRKQSREALERTTAQTEPPDAVSLDGVNTERYD